MKNCSLFLSDGPAIRARHGCTKAHSAALRVPCWDDVAIRRARQRLTEPIADRSSRTAPALAIAAETAQLSAMTPGARLSAAIEVLADIEMRRRPAADALKDWGLAHRFAGSGDRAAIGGLVFDALRRRSSAAYLMGASTPRAILFGALRLERGMSADS